MTIQEEEKEITPEPEQEQTNAETELETEPTGEADSEVIDDEQQPIQIDYDAELKKERERREAAEKVIAEEAWKHRRKKQIEEETEEEVDEDRPLTASDLNVILQRERQTLRKEIQSETILEKARKLSRSEAEAQYIVEIHKNRTFPSGLSLEEQIEESYAIANKNRIMAQNEELKRALKSKQTSYSNPAGTQRDSMSASAPKISADDLQAIKGAGFVWDGKIRLFVKQIAGGKKILTYNPKTKEQRVIAK